MEGEEAATDKTMAVYVPGTGAAYEVVLVETDDGWTVSCPALLGCHSQGDSEADALANIQEAMTGWLKLESRDVKRRVQAMVDEYRNAGFAPKTVKVSIMRFDV